MSATDYALGVSALAVAVGAVFAGAVQARRALAPSVGGAEARLMETIIALSAMVVVAELLGCVGLLYRGTLLAGCAAVGLCAMATFRRAKPLPVPQRWSRVDRRFAFAAALIAALVVAQWVAFSLDSTHYGMSHIDTLWYHLPFAGRFAQTHSITALHYTLSEPLEAHGKLPLGGAGSAFGVPTFYPATSSLLHAVALLLFGSDLPSAWLNMGWLALAFLAAWCLARPFGAGPEALISVSVLAGTGMMVLSQPGEGLNDIAVTALVLAALALVASAPGRTASLAVGGAAAGLAVGTKFNALAPAAALCIAVLVSAARRDRRRVGLALLIPLLVTGAFWYVRNLFATGNPLPYLTALGPISLPHPDLPFTNRFSYSIAHYATDFDVWSKWFVPALKRDLGSAWFLVIGLALAGIGLALARPRANGLRIVAVVAAVAVVTHLFTPLTAAGPPGSPVLFEFTLRYLSPALIAGLILLPIHLQGRARLLAIGAELIAFVTAVWPLHWPYTGFGGQGAAVAAAILAALGVGVVLRARPGPRRPLAAGVMLAVAFLLFAGWKQVKAYQYAYQSPTAGPAAAFKWARDIHSARIGIAGFFAQYPIYGRAATNYVQFVGTKTARGGFAPASTCEEWRNRINADRYDYLVFAPFATMSSVAIDPRAHFVEPIERAWTARSAAVTEVVHAAGGISVFRVHGRLDPSGC